MKGETRHDYQTSLRTWWTRARVLCSSSHTRRTTRLWHDLHYMDVSSSPRAGSALLSAPQLDEVLLRPPPLTQSAPDTLTPLSSKLSSSPTSKTQHAARSSKKKPCYNARSLALKATAHAYSYNSQPAAPRARALQRHYCDDPAARQRGQLSKITGVCVARVGEDS